MKTHIRYDFDGYDNEYCAIAGEWTTGFLRTVAARVPKDDRIWDPQLDLILARRQHHDVIIAAADSWMRDRCQSCWVGGSISCTFWWDVAEKMRRWSRIYTAAQYFKSISELEEIAARFGLTWPSTIEQVRKAFRVTLFAANAHPDQGGSSEAVVQLTRDRDELIRAIMAA